jgi:hypothetical protein
MEAQHGCPAHCRCPVLCLAGRSVRCSTGLNSVTAGLGSRLTSPKIFSGRELQIHSAKVSHLAPIVCVRCPQRALLRHHCAVVFNIRMFRSWHRSHGQHDVRRHHAECLNRSLLYEPACSPTFVSYPSNETAGAQATKRPHGLLVQICIEFCTLWPQPAQCCPRAPPAGVCMLSSRAS